METAGSATAAHSVNAALTASGRNGNRTRLLQNATMEFFIAALDAKYATDVGRPWCVPS
jgi:hypothetical protein